MTDREEQWTEWCDGQKYMENSPRRQGAHLRVVGMKNTGTPLTARSSTVVLLAGIVILGLLLALLYFSSRPTLQHVEDSADSQTQTETAQEAGLESDSVDEKAVQPKRSDEPLDEKAIYDSFPSELEDEYRNKLIELARTDDDYRWIVQHVADYSMEGGYTQAKVLRLAASDQNAKEFVRYWPERLRNYGPFPCTEELTVGEVPILYQYDSRWGYTEYSSTGFGTTGCCPTALAMVYQGLTGDVSYSPYDMGVLAKQGGYMSSTEGTNGDMLLHIGQKLGLKVYKANLSVDELVSSLEEGKVIVLNVGGPSVFTRKGHFLVAWKIASNGEVVINDPYSSVKTKQTWAADLLIEHTKVSYVFS